MPHKQDFFCFEMTLWIWSKPNLSLQLAKRQILSVGERALNLLLLYLQEGSCVWTFSLLCTLKWPSRVSDVVSQGKAMYAWCVSDAQCVSEYMACLVRSLHILKHSNLCWQRGLA